jgi:hypothetical protein
MNFHNHSNLEGRHAFLSASKYHWINYDEDKIRSYYRKFKAVQRGTALHAFAKEAIKLGIKLPDTNKTLNLYVNDAIGYGMTPEQVLYYSDNCFGTADSICFNNSMLRIHDLKTGESPTSMNQLEIYAALFCLEYNVRPQDIEIELRIYQTNDVLVHNPDPNDIVRIEKKIVSFDKIIDQMKEEE